MGLWPRTELELNEAVITWLRSHGWLVWEEVEVERFGRKADIVATRDDELWVIEGKRGFGLDVMGQAYLWDGYATRISIAVPRPQRREREEAAGRLLGEQILAKHQIGLILACQNLEGEPFVREEICAGRRHNADVNPMLDALTVAVVGNGETGSQSGRKGGERNSPYRRTCEQLARAVYDEPGFPVSIYVKDLDHHYANNRQATRELAKRLRKGEVRGVRAHNDHGKLKLFPLGE